jgi:hypothetical protein
MYPKGFNHLTAVAWVMTKALAVTASEGDNEEND